MKLRILAMLVAVVVVGTGPGVAGEQTPQAVAESVRLADLAPGWIQRSTTTGDDHARARFSAKTANDEDSTITVFARREKSLASGRKYYSFKLDQAQKWVGRYRRPTEFRRVPEIGRRAHLVSRDRFWNIKHESIAVCSIGRWWLEVHVRPVARLHDLRASGRLAVRLLRLVIQRSGLADEVEAPTTTLGVEAIVEDGDALTPADDAKLHLRFTGPDNLDGYRAVVSLVGEVATGEGAAPERFSGVPPEEQIAKFPDKGPPMVFREAGEDVQRLELPRDGTRLGAAEVKLIVAGHDNLWIYRRLIDPPLTTKANTSARGREQERVWRRKPEQERFVLLDKTVHVQVTAPTGKVVFAEPVPIKSKDGIAKLQYPDYSALAGSPPDAQARAYYRDGDPEWSYAGHPYVRALALRAARYDYKSKEWRGRTLPENDLDELVHNIAWFVHDTFQPKDFPAPIYDPSSHAKRLLEGRAPGQGKPSMVAKVGRLIPVRTTDAEALACIEHAYTFNALLRALGIPARAINAMKHFFGVSLISLGTAQDASSEAWYRARGESEARWHYFSLWNDSGRPIEDPAERYGGWGSTFDLWVGTRPWRALPERGDDETRFDVAKLEQYGVWKYYGYGGTWNFKPFWKRADTPPGIIAERTSYISYRLGSPVAATVVTKDGKRVGTTPGTLDLEAFARWMVMGGDMPRGVVNEVEGALVIPEGVTLFRTNDPASAQQLPLTILVPDPSNGAQPPSFTLELVGTGTGPYTLDVASVTSEGVQKYARQTGAVTPGKRISVEPGSLVPEGVRVPWPAPDVPTPPPAHDEEPDYAALSIPQLERRVGSDDPRAMVELAGRFASARGVAEDHGRAVTLYTRARALGSVDALVALGRHHLYGWGVKQDFEAARRLFELGREQGHPVAINGLGYLHEAGFGVARDLVKARELYDAAAALGDPKGGFNLGRCLEFGIGGARDLRRAATAYLIGADGGHANAQLNLGWMYRRGTGVVRDYARAMQWFEKAAAGGLRDAQFALGGMYYDGLGVAPDWIRALAYFQKAGDHPAALNSAAAVLLLGKHGAAVDLEKAAGYLLRSARLGNPLGRYNLGISYRDGRGLKRDPIEAYAWLNLAAAEGVDEAVKARDAFEKQLHPSQVNKAQARARALQEAGAEKTTGPGVAPQPAGGDGNDDSEAGYDKLIKRLRSPDAEHVIEAIVELARRGDRRATPSLLRLLRSHADALVRVGAASALGNLKSVDAVLGLVGSLADRAALVRAAAAESLQEITGRDFGGTGPVATRQASARAWFALHEQSLRRRLGQER